MSKKLTRTLGCNAKSVFGNISMHIWDKVFKDGPFKIFKGCLPQISLGPNLNALSHILSNRNNFLRCYIIPE